MARKPSFNVRLKGDKKLKAKFKEIKKRTPEAVAAAIFLEASRIFAKSQELVPVDTGRLRASGAVSPAGTVRQFRAIISYGTGYALAVHEREIPHAVGQRKFLEEPYREALPGMLGRMASDARKFINTKRHLQVGTVRGSRR